MERYFFMAPGVNERREAHLIFDRIRGVARDDYAIARTYDVDIAERIVRLLNADAQMVERQGGKVA